MLRVRHEGREQVGEVDPNDHVRTATGHIRRLGGRQCDFGDVVHGVGAALRDRASQLGRGAGRVVGHVGVDRGGDGRARDGVEHPGEVEHPVERRSV
jgi:hypothetical protein